MNYTLEQLRAIVDLAKRKRFDDLEEKWLELAEAPPGELRFYDSMARALLKNDARERLAELFSLMAGAMVKKGQAAQAVELVRTAWRYAPDLGALGEAAVEALAVLHGDRPNFKNFVRTAGLEQRADLLRALQRFEQFVYCDEGEVFEHQTFGIGIVETIEPERRRAAIRFADKAPKEFTLEGIRDYLEKIERGSFRAERLRDAEALKRQAFEAPGEFVRFVLKDYPDGLAQVDFKNLLLDGLLSRDEWDKWWAANRKAMRRDSHIDWGRGPRGLMRLRSEPKTYYEAVAEEFRESESTAARFALIAELAKHIEEEPAPKGLAHQLIEILQSEWESLAEDDLAERLERIYAARELARLFRAIELPGAFDETALLSQTDDPARLILSLSLHDLQCRAVETLTAADAGRATEVCAQMLPDAPPRFAQWLVERLIAQGKSAAAAGAYEQLLHAPRRNPEAFLWAVRQFFDGKCAALSAEVAPHEIIRVLAEFVKELRNQIEHGVANASALRGLQAKMKNLLAEDHYAILRQAIAPLPAAEVQTLCRLFESHAAFPDSYLASLRHAVQKARPDLEEATGATDRVDLDDSTLYVTVESLRRRRSELEHLRTVEIPKNSREIGEAAALGDLSENAEYEAARHRQHLLFKRAEELEDETRRARAIDPAWVRTDCIWVGTRFEARNVRTGETETYAILGAWDSRPEEKVLSYLTPSAAQFLHKRVGERVLVERPNSESAEYEILRIENALT
ncbi:hypothetical protein AMJ85_00735 [candidate division BRC1 bacterium SM23_51]|nr:MAG: hypothetical protein AMJ85_00735 [candidate division BRC1 bacterium SM23_51]